MINERLRQLSIDLSDALARTAVLESILGGVLNLGGFEGVELAGLVDAVDRRYTKHDEVQNDNRDLKARVAELEAYGVQIDAQVDDLNNRLERKRSRVTELETHIRDSIPANARTGEVPRDGNAYRVFIRPQSIVVVWERGPNVWNNRTPIDDVGWDSDASWYVNNAHDWLPEPDQSGEGGS